MNRRTFFKTVGIPVLALPFVKWLPKPESDTTWIAHKLMPSGITLYERYGTILRKNRKWYMDIICPVCNHNFGMIRPKYPHASMLKLVPTHCNKCSYLLKIDFEYIGSGFHKYRQITEAQKMKNPYRAYYHP